MEAYAPPVEQQDAFFRGAMYSLGAVVAEAAMAPVVQADLRMQHFRLTGRGEVAPQTMEIEAPVDTAPRVPLSNVFTLRPEAQRYVTGLTQEAA